MGTASRVVIIGLLLLVCATICMASRTLPTLDRATYDNTHSLADHSGNGGGTEAATGRGGYRDGRVYGDEKWKKGKVHATRLLPIPILDDNEGNATDSKVYIVHVRKPNNTELLQFADLDNWYKSFLPNTTLDSGEPRLIYSYHRVISGFAARLTDVELKAVESMEGFVYAHQERVHIVHTTYTPTYLRLHQTWDYDLWANANFGAGKIIGVIDSGIDPDHPSFHDKNMPQKPQPPVWTGQCFWRNKCNRKLIGIRAFRHGWIPGPIRPRILASLTLGNGTEIEGESGYQPDNFTPGQLPIVYPGGLINDIKVERCDVSLHPFNVKGKLVVCWAGALEPVHAGQKVKNAGGAGMIFINGWWSGNTTSPEPHVLPVANVGFEDGKQIVDYIKSTPNPTASITFKHTQFNVRPTPAVASFSSRGPSTMNYGIIKPDVIAPGENILAAWPKLVGPSPTGTYSKFKFLSGTSMATPHVSGIVALLMNLYPNWSPERIKSALMTSSLRLNINDGKPIEDEYNHIVSANAMGSGHVVPLAAINPGLVYDLYYYDYVHYLCGAGISDYHLSTILAVSASCSQVNGIPLEQLNYPSFAVRLGSNPVTVSRVVTNVGKLDSEYQVEFDEPKRGEHCCFSPTIHHFTQKEESLRFEVTFSVNGVPPNPGVYREGQLAWVSPKNIVRSPIVVTFY
ncbi:hypothetical protein J5N97_018751 [Dioscorea zingiberensis]|uniref:Uncharacterized protein n=1 Tax=Dioscorea zingiberensis TaxID=325984 RepID=A0A9D5CCR3_9LILI|nr:hypothetical protein J5N97_018751 [Dioscorea zingiberensis]